MRERDYIIAGDIARLYLAKEALYQCGIAGGIATSRSLAIRGIEECLDKLTKKLDSARARGAVGPE